MAFTLNSVITIGKYTFKGGVNELTINKSVYTILDTAKLKIPGLGRVVSLSKVYSNALALAGQGNQQVADNLPDSGVQTAKLFKEGDPVSIDLGYNGDLRNEFRGFVRRVSLTTPIVIDLEGYAWQLRHKSYTISWKRTTVREVLEHVTQGTDIALSPDIPRIPLTNFILKGQTGLDVLEHMQSKFLLTVYFDDNVLYVGLLSGRTTADSGNTGSTLALVKYSIGYNVPTDQPDLQQRLADDTQVFVKLKVKQRDGKSTVRMVGDLNGQQIERTLPNGLDGDDLQNIATDLLQQNKYTGYQGSLLAFLQPYCKPGWRAALQDKRYAGARAGTYFVTGTQTTFGIRGAKRKVSISFKLS